MNNQQITITEDNCDEVFGEAANKLEEDEEAGLCDNCGFPPPQGIVFEYDVGWVGYCCILDKGQKRLFKFPNKK